MPDLTTPRNALYFGDNLDVLRDPTKIAPASVDLIYLDLPFNSARSYNLLFKNEQGCHSDAQIQAFDDTWHWNDSTQETYRELQVSGPPHVARMVTSLHDAIGANQMMAYLVMMAARLVELHRVLKPTGSLYLHCDPTASHYLKVILDTIFGPQHFRNEIVGNGLPPIATPSAGPMSAMYCSSILNQIPSPGILSIVITRPTTWPPSIAFKSRMAGDADSVI
jgi:DNA methylase